MEGCDCLPDPVTSSLSRCAACALQSHIPRLGNCPASLTQECVSHALAQRLEVVPAAGHTAGYGGLGACRPKHVLARLLLLLPLRRSLSALLLRCCTRPSIMQRGQQLLRATHPPSSRTALQLQQLQAISWTLTKQRNAALHATHPPSSRNTMRPPQSSSASCLSRAPKAWKVEVRNCRPAVEGRGMRGRKGSAPVRAAHAVQLQP